MFDRRSGLTHLIDPLCALVLELLAAGRDAASLHAAVVAELGVAPAEVPRERIALALDRLRGAHLIDG